MITRDEYFGLWREHKDATSDMWLASERMLGRVNGLLQIAAVADVRPPINPKTGSMVAGETYGGFRPKSCPIGAPDSSHKKARGVDVFDPDRALVAWCMSNRHELKARGLHMEHPKATPGWCHLTDRPPPSGKTVFLP